MKRRKLEENIFKGMMFIALFLVFAVLAGIILVVTVKGLSSLNLSMIIDTPKGGYYLGKEGGIANAIVGSLYLMAGATFLAFVISLPVALALQKEYLGKRFADFTRLILDILWGTPSIVYGAFGFVVMVFLGLRASLLGGIIVLTLLMIPIMTRAMDETIRLVPFELKEMAYALGTTRMETTFAVVLKQALPGIFTAIILAFGRGIGDAASILFTAGYTDEIPSSLLDPVASLPLAVFFQVGTPVPEVQARAFVAALILLFIVMVINVIARLLGWRFSKNIVR
ncbi:MAG TPA: PstA family ABC transporter permease [Smithellaceae bacterium]|jgi:phosphate transport system permease protein|nr:PstA family ABC transporter permease [Smithellaceae bacterium]